MQTQAVLAAALALSLQHSALVMERAVRELGCSLRNFKEGSLLPLVIAYKRIVVADAGAMAAAIYSIAFVFSRRGGV